MYFLWVKVVLCYIVFCSCMCVVCFVLHWVFFFEPLCYICVCVPVCICVCVSEGVCLSECIWVCRCACGRQKLMLGVSLSNALPYLSGQGLSLNLILINLARLSGQQAPGILLVLSPQVEDYRRSGCLTGCPGSEIVPSGLHWTISPACFGFWVSLLVCVCVFDQLIYPRVNFISLVLSQECLRGWGRLVTSLRPIWTIARPCLNQSIYHYISSNFSHSSGWIVQLPPGRGEEVNEKITSETMSTWGDTGKDGWGTFCVFSLARPGHLTPPN